MTTVEVLRAARALIADESKWWRGGCAVAGQACMFNAVSRAGGEPYTDAHKALLRAIGCNEDEPTEGFAWNDSHTHAEVMAAFDRAIAIEEAKAQEFSVEPFPVFA